MMVTRILLAWITACVLGAVPISALAAHPFITDDTGTQDTGNHQIELNTDYQTFAGARTRLAAFTYSYGLLPHLDALVNLPADLSSPSGIGDASIGVKWRFWEHGTTSLGLKPELYLPSGDADKGLGNGKTSGSVTLLAQHGMEPWSFYGNLGVGLNRYRDFNDRAKNQRVVWRASTAVAYSFAQKTRLLADIGIARNPARSANKHPAFALIGIIHSPRENVDIDIGLKRALNDAEADRQVGAGLTIRF